MSENGNEVEKIVLYQKWPSKAIIKYGVSHIGNPTKMLTVFPATAEGLDEAIEMAERPDAILVKLTSDYTQAVHLINYVEDKIERKKFVKIFRPVNRIPRS